MPPSFELHEGAYCRGARGLQARAAAAELGIALKTLYNKLARYEAEPL